MSGKCGLGSFVQISVGYSQSEEGTCIISISFYRHPTDFSGPVFFCPKLTRVRNKPFGEGYPLSAITFSFGANALSYLRERFLDLDKNRKETGH